MSYDVFTGALRMFDNFQGDETKIQYLSHPSLAVLKKQYALAEIAGEGSTFDRANRMLIWLAAHVYHKGDYDSSLTNGIDLLNYSLDKGPEFGINCRSLSAILMEICLSVGIFARQMFLMPLSPYDGDNHVVCEVWLAEEKRWVMLDPSYGGYVMGENGRPFSLLELREALAHREKILFSDGFHYNGDRNLDFEDITCYYAKNLFYFRCSQVQTFGSDGSAQPQLYFVPKGYDPVRAQFACVEYKEKIFGSHPWLTERKSALAKEQSFFCGKEILLVAPEWGETE